MTLNAGIPFHSHDICRSRLQPKHDALKNFAGGIAHDFNNVLTAIMGNISLARMDVPADSQLFQMLKEIEEATLSQQGI